VKIVYTLKELLTTWRFLNCIWNWFFCSSVGARKIWILDVRAVLRNGPTSWCWYQKDTANTKPVKINKFDLIWFHFDFKEFICSLIMYISTSLLKERDAVWNKIKIKCIKQQQRPIKVTIFISKACFFKGTNVWFWQFWFSYD
jgi:hypothetical protein